MPLYSGLELLSNADLVNLWNYYVSSGSQHTDDEYANNYVPHGGARDSISELVSTAGLVAFCPVALELNALFWQFATEYIML
ncbi:hypothetical protein JCGZ_10620 [Jatropha curcas]|uniref:Uncharacterized protein n=1 Tax=Jatropha curcas TaxID=180498 RepID=A0A067KHX1_JATCU|nr:hypothetical protein JCGZ_10620 [Jatropha curcas]